MDSQRQQQRVNTSPPVWPPVRNASTSTPIILSTSSGTPQQPRTAGSQYETASLTPNTLSHYHGTPSSTSPSITSMRTTTIPSLGTNYTTTSSNEYSSGPSFISALRQYQYTPSSNLSSPATPLSTNNSSVLNPFTQQPPPATNSVATSTHNPTSTPSQQQHNSSSSHQQNVTAVNLYHLLTSQMSSQLATSNGGFISMSTSNPMTTSTSTANGTSTERIIAITDPGTQPGQSSATARDNSATTSGERWMRMAASSRRANDMAAVRRQFRGKVVCNLSCGDCGVLVCKRGMKAILLADTTVELFSTDSPPIGVQMVNDDYETRNCHCRIRDVACLNCGNLVGYHVTQPCTDCLGSCNNGHFWMFNLDSVFSEDRMDGTGSKVLLWAHLPRESEEVRNEMRVYEAMCR